MPAPEGDNPKQKGHRERNAGRKADKKKAKKEHKQDLTDKQRNPKAFTFNSAIKAERRFRRKQDINTKKQHIPVVDRTPLEPPPFLVAVVGPPKVGKSLVIQCLIKSYTKQPLTNICGPVTVVSGKKRRVTFMECNNDLNSMIDIAKVADLVLLLVDASFGFEMEMFEFLNICQVHGMPRILGVLTHLDQIKNAKQLKKTKKMLKHRFWTEVYAGAKLFYLSGLMHHEYLRQEVKNLARFISVMKLRPLTWRSTHPYLLADRVEDLTDPEKIRQNPKVDRNISLYGYVRGVPLGQKSSIHIPGCGDLKIKEVSFLPDPCPLPEQLKKRALVEKEKLIYAPFSGVGGIVYDKDAVYIELGGSHSHKKEEDPVLITNLLETQETLDIKLQRSELQLFSDAAPIKTQDVDADFSRGYTSENVVDNGRIRRKVIFLDKKNVANEEENEDASDDEENEDASEDEENDANKVLEDGENEPESEESSDDEDENEDAPEKKRKLFMCRTESDEEIDDIEGSKVLKKKKKVEKSENTEKYHSLSKNSDKYVKDKIAEALSFLENIPRKREEAGNASESYDELSEDERKDLITRTDKDGDKNQEEDEMDEDDEQSAADSEEEEKEEELSDDLKWRSNLAEKARESFVHRQRNNKNMMKIVYGCFNKSLQNNEEDKKNDSDTEDQIGNLFRVVKEQQKQKLEDKELKNLEECVFYSTDQSRDWLEEDNKVHLTNRFVTGKWKESEDAAELLKLDDLEDDEVDGDFEDLETGEKHEAKKTGAPKEMTTGEMDEKKKLLEKKRKLKEKFDSEYDNGEGNSYYEELKMEAERQAKLNKLEFENYDDEMRVQLEGFRAGMYVRVEIDSVPCELITNLDPTFPIVVGGLLPGEENIGFVQTRIKKHRWYSKILKTRDPLILSVGWRRFQTMPIYSKLEDNMRHRMLKYTPEHVACIAHFWGPITPQATGVLAVQDVAARISGFRIAATGTIVEMDKSTRVVKKLKLTGVPFKIHKKTAFIKDMFTTELEVAKFEGSRIKTVSGIRGQVKKAYSRHTPGCFRATFEDKIQLSDIVFCRTWYRVDIPKFYNPVTSLLLAPGEKSQWRGMKTVGELKRERNIRALPNTDSMYTPIEREAKVFRPLMIPRNLQKELPYKDKPKLQMPSSLRRKTFEEKRVAVVREPQEEKVAQLMKMIRTNYANKQEKLKAATHKRITEYQARVDAETAKKMQRQKTLKKQVFRDLSKLEAKQNKR